MRAKLITNVSNWKVGFLALLLSFLANGAQPDFSKYVVLKIGFQAITTDGRIDFRRWGKWDFPFCEPISIGRYRYTPVNDLYFLTSSPEEHPNARNEEQTRRYEKELNAKAHLAIINGKIFYRGRKLNYPAKIRGGNRPWGSTVWDDPPQGFLFGDYLIFMVQVRLYFRENPFDLVVYNLQDDTFAVHQTFGCWPSVEVFRYVESVPDPRKTNSVHPKAVPTPNPTLNSDPTATTR